ncbi:MAG TPA: hypothetical protein VFQ44_01965 [Streptosporangiaceae bacterium]|nr:hypothetical protein [Streptosporangiaceae bacterium]
MRFRNPFGYERHVQDAGVVVPAGGEFDWPGWDLKIHGPLAGFEALNPMPDDVPRATPRGGTPPSAAPGTDPPAPKTTTTATGASKEK